MSSAHKTNLTPSNLRLLGYFTNYFIAKKKLGTEVNSVYSIVLVK